MYNRIEDAELRYTGDYQPHKVNAGSSGLKPRNPHLEKDWG